MHLQRFSTKTNTKNFILSKKVTNKHFIYPILGKVFTKWFKFAIINKKRKSMSDKAKLKSISFLVERYNLEIEKIKKSESYNTDNKIQTVAVLREIVEDLTIILEAK